MRSFPVFGSARSARSVLCAVLCVCGVAIPAVLVPALAASSEEDPAALPPCEAGKRPLLSISKDVPPRIDWSPRCGVGELLVEDERNSFDVWVIETPGESGIGPGVVYGSVPEGASDRGASARLEDGGHYRVTLRSWRPGQASGTWIVTSVPFIVGKGGPINPIPGPPCGRNVKITVLAESPPRFTWDPPCRVHEIRVEHADGKDVWVAGAPLEVGVKSGLAYGETPEGGQQLPAPPLTAGETYRVSIRRHQPDFRSGRMQRRVLIGQQEFVP